jgi:hypothetical protein
LWLIAVGLAFAACGPGTGALTLRTVPDPVACPGAALPLPATFRIDATAEDQIVAIAPDGRTYQVWWAPGFRGGDASDPVVRDPDGLIVARDGEVLDGSLLHGHTVCATGDDLYILLS